MFKTKTTDGTELFIRTSKVTTIEFLTGDRDAKTAYVYISNGDCWAIPASEAEKLIDLIDEEDEAAQRPQSFQQTKSFACGIDQRAK